MGAAQLGAGLSALRSNLANQEAFWSVTLFSLSDAPIENNLWDLWAWHSDFSRHNDPYDEKEAWLSTFTQLCGWKLLRR